MNPLHRASLLLATASMLFPLTQAAAPAAVSAKMTELQEMARQAQVMEDELAKVERLPEVSFNPHAEMPQAGAGETAVLSESGMYFDNLRSCLIYIGNVRLNNERIRLRAAHRLYVLMPENEKKSVAKDFSTNTPTKQTAAETPAATSPGNRSTTSQPDGAPSASVPTAPPAAVPSGASAANASGKALPAESPPPPSAEKAPDKSPAVPSGNAPPAESPASPSAPDTPPAPPQPPVLVTVQNAAVDVPGDKALLEGLPQNPSVSVQWGDNSLFLQMQQNGQPAWVYADPVGNVLLVGAHFKGNFTQEGRHYVLTAERGPAYYDAASRTLTVVGPATLASEGDSISGDEQMCVSFAPSDQPPPPPRGAFSQFTGMRLGPVQGAVARGHVVCVRAAQNDRPAARISGDLLTYDAVNGACRVQGAPCSLDYGAHSLHTKGTIFLEPNGDARVDGGLITGTYERPVSRDTAASVIAGTYRTKGPLLYDAHDNKVIFPAGLRADDKLAHFSCTGRAELFLRAISAPTPPQKTGMLNLAIARRQEVLRLSAQGNVKLHSAATPEQPELDASCDVLVADVAHGSALLRSLSGAPSHAHYGQYTLDAQSAPKIKSEVLVADNGNIAAAGTSLHSQLPVQAGMVDIRCTKFLHLERTKCLLFLGPNSSVVAPNGILTARGVLQAILSEDPTQRPPMQKYPHLHYPYTGLRQAATNNGGSLRTLKMSLQCDGPMSIRLIPGKKPTDNFRECLEYASASTHVRVAGKDTEGTLRRADGESLSFDRSSGNFYLRGPRVLLLDKDNTHTASGHGACVTLDPDNNVHVTGEHQMTTATRFRQQVESRRKK